MTENAKGLDALVAKIAAQVKPAVEVIEAKVPTTRGHYGDYMAIFSRFCNDVGQARVLALALIKAGGNVQGVKDALQVSFGGAHV